MSPDFKIKLRNLLVQQEEYRQFPYIDKTGHITIGIGRNLSARGISTSESLALLDDDVFFFNTKLTYYVAYFNELDEVRRMVLISMAIHLGMQDFLDLKGMITAIDHKDFEAAANEILSSKAASQDADRYQQLAFMMKTGELPPCFVS